MLALINRCDHVPYRNCKLTQLLQPCLGRGCRVALVVTASPTQIDAPETVQTLAFGVRARGAQLGPAAAFSGGGAAGGGAASSGTPRETARLTKALVEAKQAAATAERELATARQQSSAFEEANKAAAANAKRAEVRAPPIRWSSAVHASTPAPTRCCELVE